MFYLYILEDGERIEVGKADGYPTLEEARQEALKRVDDALPRNTVLVLQDVGYAYLAGDGGNEWKPAPGK